MVPRTFHTEIVLRILLVSLVVLDHCVVYHLHAPIGVKHCYELVVCDRVRPDDIYDVIEVCLIFSKVGTVFVGSA